MTKVRTSVTLDEDLLRAVRIRAARSGKDADAVIEEALRRDLALEMIERLWRPNDISDSEAQALAAEVRHATRPRKKEKP